MTFTSKPILLAALVTLAGCSPFAGLEGEWSSGERGHTRWQIADGLCPGLGGGCNLDVPLAEGATTSLRIEGAEDATTGPDVSGALTTGLASRDEEDGDWRVAVTATRAGTGRIAFNTTSGLLDAASVEVRRATQLECGLWSDTVNPSWDMRGLETQASFSVPFIDADHASLHLVCRASDSTGPLMSADAITWEVLDGADVLTLQETGFGDFFGGPIHGARIQYATPARGTAVVRATLGDVTQELTITVE